MDNIQTDLLLSGLTCEACEKVITKRLNKIAGVSSVRVASQTGATSITASRSISKQEVTQALTGTHYQVVNNL